MVALPSGRQAGGGTTPFSMIAGGSSGRECSFMQGESDPGSQKAQTRRLEQKKGVSAE